MADPIVIDVEFNGAEAAARGASRVAGAVRNLGAEERTAADAASRLAAEQALAATKALAFGQRVAGVANAAQALIGQLGGQSRTAGLIGATISASTQFAQLGAALGPQGALVGGIVGAAIPAIQAIANAEREAQEAAERHMATLRDAVGTIDDYVAAIGRQESALRQRGLVDQGLGSAAEQQGAVRQAEAQLRLENARVDTLRRQRDAAREAHSFWNDTTAEVAALNERLAEADGLRQTAANFVADAAEREAQARAEIAALNEEDGERMMAALQSGGAPAAGRASGARRSGGPSPDEIQEENTIAFLEREAAGRQAVLDAVMRQKSAEQELRAEEAARHQEQMQEHEAKMDATRAQLDLETQAAEERRQLVRENTDLLIEANRRAGEAHRAQVEEYQQVTSVIVGGLTDALASIIAGQKTAEEAFKGLLASFLKFISEQSMLKAASEFAFAIADFASQNYSGGAQHTAAGVAFTAVAVAAGAGAAAVSAPSAGANDGPEEGRSSRDEGKSGDVVINYNAPVMALGDRAQLGREIRGLVGDADARYGA